MPRQLMRVISAPIKSKNTIDPIVIYVAQLRAALPTFGWCTARRYAEQKASCGVAKRKSPASSKHRGSHTSENFRAIDNAANRLTVSYVAPILAQNEF
jgi:hypothetical protein